MTVEELESHVEKHNDGLVYVKLGPKTFTKLHNSLPRDYQQMGENWFDYWGLRIICVDRRVLREYQNQLALEHLVNVLGSYDWGIEE